MIERRRQGGLAANFYVFFPTLNFGSESAQLPDSSMTVGSGCSAAQRIDSWTEIVMATQRTGQQRLTIYIVDADHAFRESLMVLLESAGYAARTYSSYDEFLQHNWKSGNSWQSIELRLPEMSGATLLHAIEGHSGDPPLLVTVLRGGTVSIAC